MRAAMQGRVLLGLFVLSGFSGLIYQSIWSHYLGLVLGHAAYAQALVLAIFMGGMALGAWLASRSSVNWHNLLLRYAVLEMVVGVLGLAFHSLFEGYIAFSQDSVLPVLASPWAAHAYQWTTAAVLILPQCVLLGMTFPLMSAAYLRLAPDQDGKVLGGLYFSNSLGAALGALAAVFLLLPAVGMPGAMFTAGLLNIFVALGAWLVWKSLAGQPGQPSDEQRVVTADPNRDRPALARFLLACAFVTGATSFVYEIGWVRMLNLALGTTLHSFELMLAAFILGLAFGGLRIRQQSAHIDDAVRSAGWAQVMMGVCALLSVVLLAQSFRWVSWLMQALQKNDAGYDMFMVGSALIALLVMFPAAFFAGKTLPLFTIALLRQGGSERRIGQVYASNTLGAITGVVLMVYGLIPWLGLHGAVLASAMADILLGIVLLGKAQSRPKFAIPLACIATVAALWAAIGLGQVDPRMRLGGVYRSGDASLDSAAKVLYQRDGKTATVAVTGWPGGGRVISTNGKTDAGLVLDLSRPASPDETTMVMLGLMPNLMHPDPNDVAVIGWGSGLSTHTILGSSKPRMVETIEIEPAMIEGARLFGDRVGRAYNDPRSKIRIDDARTHFAMGNRQYDAIVSEPSNPWVSGVASLFTKEFYGFLRGHLRPGGVLVQWIQAYELDGDLLATMLAALLTEFPDSDLYVTQTNDLLVLARTGPALPMDTSVFDNDPLRSELKRVGLRSPADIAMRRIGGAEVLRAYVASHAANPHSDYFPTVSLNAPRSRFKQSSALELLDIVDTGMPVAEMLDGYQVQTYDALAGVRAGRFAFRKNTAYALAQRLRKEPKPVEYYGVPTPMAEMQALMKISEGRIQEADLPLWTQYAADTVSETLAPLRPEELEGVWIRPVWIESTSQPQLVQDVMAALDAAARRDASQMLPTALAVLENPAPGVSGRLRDLMLTQAQLAALRLHRPDQVDALEQKYGPSTGGQSYPRHFLLAWAALDPSLRRH